MQNQHGVNGFVLMVLMLIHCKMQQNFYFFFKNISYCC